MTREKTYELATERVFCKDCTKGLSVNVAVHAMSVLTSKGVDTERATLMLSSAISNIIKPSEGAKEVSGLLIVDFKIKNPWWKFWR